MKYTGICVKVYFVIKPAMLIVGSISYIHHDWFSLIAFMLMCNYGIHPLAVTGHIPIISASGWY